MDRKRRLPPPLPKAAGPVPVELDGLGDDTAELALALWPDEPTRPMDPLLQSALAGRSRRERAS